MFNKLFNTFGNRTHWALYRLWLVWCAERYQTSVGKSRQFLYSLSCSEMNMLTIYAVLGRKKA